MIRKSEIRQLIREEIKDWYARLSKALLHVENQRRLQAKMALFPKTTVVWLPQGPNAELFLLTLKVWCLRYNITPEFILDHLTTYFQNSRKIPYGNNIPGSNITLGISASVIAGASARKYIEEVIVHTFPNGENRKQISQPQPPMIHIRSYETIEQMINEYKTSAIHAQKQFDIRMHKISRVSGGYQRNFRKSLRENL